MAAGNVALAVLVDRAARRHDDARLALIGLGFLAAAAVLRAARGGHPRGAAGQPQRRVRAGHPGRAGPGRAVHRGGRAGVPAGPGGPRAARGGLATRRAVRRRRGLGCGVAGRPAPAGRPRAGRAAQRSAGRDGHRLGAALPGGRDPVLPALPAAALGDAAVVDHRERAARGIHARGRAGLQLAPDLVAVARADGARLRLRRVQRLHHLPARGRDDRAVRRDRHRPDPARGARRVRRGAGGAGLRGAPAGGGGALGRRDGVDHLPAWSPGSGSPRARPRCSGGRPVRCAASASRSTGSGCWWPSGTSPGCGWRSGCCCAARCAGWPPASVATVCGSAWSPTAGCASPTS